MNNSKPRINKIDISVGKNVRKYRKYKKMTVVKLARNLDITHQQINKYETGIDRISVGRLWEISNILRIPINFFYNDIEDYDNRGSSTDENISILHKLSLLCENDKKSIIDMINDLLEQP